MSNNRYDVRFVFYTGEESITVVTSRNSTNALKNAIHQIRHEYEREDVRSMHIKGDPVPVEKRARRAAQNEAAKRHRERSTVSMSVFPGDDGYEN